MTPLLRSLDDVQKMLASRPGTAVVLACALCGCGLDGEAAPDAASALSQAGFRQDEPATDDLSEDAAMDTALPPERLWAPGDLGMGTKGKAPCFPATAKDYDMVLGRAGEIEVEVKDFTALFHAYTLDSTKPRIVTIEMRKDIVHELIDQELLALVATRKGYESTQVGDLLRKRELADMIRKDMKKQAESEIGEESYKKHYKANPKKYMIHPDQRRVVQILVKGKKNAQKIQDGIRDAKPKLSEIVKMARTVSIDPEAGETGGKTGWFDREGMGESGHEVPENVALAAFKLKNAGDISGQPLPSSAGWHVVVLLASRNEKWIPYSKVRGSIVARFVDERTEVLVDNLLDSMKKNHPVSVQMSLLEKISPVPCL